MNSIAATPTKLRSGNWGATVKGATVTEGDIVQITTRAGKTWAAAVTKVVWSGNGATIVATESLDRRPTPARNTSRRSACPTDGNCSSFGDGRSCGAYDCDGF